MAYYDKSLIYLVRVITVWGGPYIHLIVLASCNKPVTITTELQRQNTALVFLQLVLLCYALVNIEQLDIAGFHTETYTGC